MRKLLTIVVFTLLCFGCAGTEDDVLLIPPTVKTNPVFDIESNSAFLSGEITLNGSQEIIKKGFLWGVSPNLTNEANQLISTLDGLIFDGNLIDLSPNSMYYVKAFVETKNGFYYGQELSFSTKINFTIPVVTTKPITFNQINTIIVGGEVVSSSSDVTTRGVCYSKSPNPTYGLATTIPVNSNLETFEVRITTTMATTYYIRAFAINSEGIAYGQEIAYTTLSTIFSQDGQMIDIEENTYPTILINNQKWMQKNLNVTQFRNGDVIPEIKDYKVWLATTTPAWCYYANKTENGIVYGKLYNHYAIEDPRGLAPLGWHIPSVKEAQELVSFMGNESSNSFDSDSFREVGVSHWLTPNTGATNTSGLTILPGGYRSIQETFVLDDGLGRYGNFWLSDIVPEGPNTTPNLARVFTIDKDFNAGKIGYEDRKAGRSVRCIKD